MPREAVSSAFRSLFAALLCGAAAVAQAGEGGPAPDQAALAHQHAPADGRGGHPGGRHHLMAMATGGGGERGGAYLSSGVGYEYRLPWFGDLVGVGGMAELMLMSGHAPHPMLMASASLHPYGGLFLQGAAGASHVHERASSASGGTRMSTQAVFRLAAGYDVHLRSLMVTPLVDVDLGGRARRAVAAGLCVGRMF